MNLSYPYEVAPRCMQDLSTLGPELILPSSHWSPAPTPKAFSGNRVVRVPQHDVVVETCNSAMVALFMTPCECMMAFRHHDMPGKVILRRC